MAVENKNMDEEFRNNVRITFEGTRRTAPEHIEFPKQTVELTGVHNIREDVKKSIKDFMVKESGKFEDFVKVQLCRGGGIGANVLYDGYIDHTGMSLYDMSNLEVELEVTAEHPEQLRLPDGNTYDKLKNYSWTDIYDLELAAQNADKGIVTEPKEPPYKNDDISSKEAVDAFTAAVAELSGQEGGRTV